MTEVSGKPLKVFKAQQKTYGPCQLCPISGDPTPIITILRFQTMEVRLCQTHVNVLIMELQNPSGEKIYVEK